MIFRFPQHTDRPGEQASWNFAVPPVGRSVARLPLLLYVRHLSLPLSLSPPTVVTRSCCCWFSLSVPLFGRSVWWVGRSTEERKGKRKRDERGGGGDRRTDRQTDRPTECVRRDQFGRIGRSSFRWLQKWLVLVPQFLAGKLVIHSLRVSLLYFCWFWDHWWGLEKLSWVGLRVAAV